MALIAVGGSQWPPVSQFDLFPLLGVLLALLIARFALGLPLTIPTTIIAIIAGTAWAWSVESWGWPVATLAGLLFALSLTPITSKFGQAGRGGRDGTNAQAD